MIVIFTPTFFIDSVFLYWARPHENRDTVISKDDKQIIIIKIKSKRFTNSAK